MIQEIGKKERKKRIQGTYAQDLKLGNRFPPQDERSTLISTVDPILAPVILPWK